MVVNRSTGPIAVCVAVEGEAGPILKKMFVKEKNELADQTFYLCGLDNHTIILAVIGVGMENARKGIDTLTREYNPSVIISIGFAGAVIARLKRGDIILGDEISFEHDPERCFNSDKHLMGIAENALKGASLPYTKGGISTVSDPLCTAEEKRRFGSRSGSLVVEMESAVLAEAAIEQGIRFLCVRVVFDRANDNLRLSPQNICNEGQVSILKSIKFLVFHPGLVPDFIKLNLAWTVSGNALQATLFPILKSILTDPVKKFTGNN